MVSIPIAGQFRRIMLDIGAGPGLILTEKLWAKISGELQVLSTKKSRLSTPIHGWVPCNNIVVKQLAVGNVLIRNAKICVMPNDTPYGENDFTLGIGFFKGTVVVLDFKYQLLWVKSPKSL